MIHANLGFGTALAEAAACVPELRFVNTATVWQHFDAAPYSPVSLSAATKQAFADILVFYAEVEGLAVHTLELMDTYGPGGTRPKLSPRPTNSAAPTNNSRSSPEPARGRSVTATLSSIASRNGSSPPPTTRPAARTAQTVAARAKTRPQHPINGAGPGSR